LEVKSEKKHIPQIAETKEGGTEPEKLEKWAS